jgi:hypothetical protein
MTLSPISVGHSFVRVQRKKRHVLCPGVRGNNYQPKRHIISTDKTHRYYNRPRGYSVFRFSIFADSLAEDRFSRQNLAELPLFCDADTALRSYANGRAERRDIIGRLPLLSSLAGISWMQHVNRSAGKTPPLDPNRRWIQRRLSTISRRFRTGMSAIPDLCYRPREIWQITRC